MALVLSRENGEEIVIGDDIVVRVIGSNRGIVRLAITAPDSTTIHRREIYDLINEREGEDGLQNKSRNNIA